MVYALRSLPAATAAVTAAELAPQALQKTFLMFFQHIYQLYYHSRSVLSVCPTFVLLVYKCDSCTARQAVNTPTNSLPANI
jgi:hypothetical protein